MRLTRPQAMRQEAERGNRSGVPCGKLNRIGEFDERLSGLNDMLADIDSLLNDFNRELSGCMEDFAYSEENFYQVEKRLDLINRLKSKYGNSLEEIGAYEKAQEEKLEHLEHLEENRKILEEETEKNRKKLQQSSDRLKETSDKLCRKTGERYCEKSSGTEFSGCSF